MRIRFVFIFFFTALGLSAQTNISGIINTYDTLVSQSSAPCFDELLTDGSISYNAGDLLLIIVTQGATYDNSNTNTFGNFVNLNSVGLYEFAYITAFSNGKITLDRKLQNSFPTGTQIVKVPQYASAEVNNGPLTAKVYDGKTGGIVALKANKLELHSSINADGIGYKGGFSLRNMGYSCSESDLFYPENDNGGAPKGEGPAKIQQSQKNGRGSVTMGGGGGNNHNAGGGGGANAGSGGQGGDEWSGCSPSASVGGFGGKTPGNIATTRVYMGGGGGSGHNNLSNFSSKGGHGGGIVILIVDTIVTNNFGITVAGFVGKTIANNGAEGAGGGGGGGSILLNTSYIVGNLGLLAQGGDGGDVTSGTAGPGGGGGGGFIAVPTSSQLNPGANITTNVNGGTAGDLGSPGNNYSAVAGNNGILDNTFSLNIQAQITPKANFFPADTSLCTDNFVLAAPVNGPFLWSTGSTDSSITISNSGTYWLRVGNPACAVSDTIVVNLARPVPFSLGADTSLCPGDSMILQAPNDPALSLTWDDGSSSVNRTVYPGGSYWLQVKKDSCISRDTINVGLVNIARPKIFNASDSTICESQPITVDLTKLPGTVLWQDGESRKLRTLADSGLYWVEWTTPCLVFRDSLLLETINCEDCQMTVPNAFTPNGDGLNDRFQVFFGCPVVLFKMEVMNRWGSRIFTSNSEQQFWDGRVKNRKAPEGVYIYKIMYRTQGRIDTRFEQGIINLIR